MACRTFASLFLFATCVFSASAALQHKKEAVLKISCKGLGLAKVCSTAKRRSVLTAMATANRVDKYCTQLAQFAEQVRERVCVCICVCMCVCVFVCV